MTRCPGQDQRYWKPEDIFDARCPHCETEIEFWKDEPMRVCRGCGAEVRNPRIDLGCAKWCAHADECIGQQSANDHSQPQSKATSAGNMKKMIMVVLGLGILFTGCATLEDRESDQRVGNVAYEMDGQQFEGYFISSAPRAPLVLLIHDWDGITEYEIKRARMLSELGYSVFCADLYGLGVRPTELSEKRRLTSELYADRGRMRRYLQKGLRVAQSKGGNVENAVAMGYCFGGTAILELARSGAELKGFVAFHGGLETPAGQDYAKTKGRILILHGTSDTHVTMEHFAVLATELEKNSVRHEMITYGDAPHAFSVFGSSSYRAEADRKSWKRFTEFLSETLGE